MSACSGGDRFFYSDSSIPYNKAVLVGKVALDVKEPMPVFINFSSAPDFFKVNTNEYFAILVDAGPNTQLTEMQFVIDDTKYHYHTHLLKTKFDINTGLADGSIYSIGVIDIKVSPLAYDKDNRIQYVIPKNIGIDTDLTPSVAWFSSQFPKSRKSIKEASVTIRTTTEENKFQKNEIGEL